MRRVTTASYLLLCISVCVSLAQDSTSEDVQAVDPAPTPKGSAIPTKNSVSSVEDYTLEDDLTGDPFFFPEKEITTPGPVYPTRRCRRDDVCVPASSCEGHGHLQDGVKDLKARNEPEAAEVIQRLVDDRFCDRNNNMVCCEPEPCEYGPFYDCSVSCGNGTRWKVSEDKPKDCKRQPTIFEPCNMGECPPPPPPGDEVILQDPMSDFTQSVYLRLLETEGDENFVFSPLSLHTALSMLYLGTTAGSTTEEEFNKIMGDVSNKTLLKKGYKTVIDSYSNQANFLYGNKFWRQNGTNLNSKYNETVVDIFQADIDIIDFVANNSVDIVNDWVKDMTKGKIKKIADNFAPNTQLYLANALYFKEGWKEPFKTTDLSGARPLFWRYDFMNGTTSNISMIRQTFLIYEDNVTYTEIFNETEVDRVQVLSIPYKNDQFEFQIIAPNSRQGMENLVRRMNDSQHGGDRFNLFSHPANEDRYHDERSEVNLFMPTFQAKSDLDVVDLLQQLGVENVFTDAAELGELTESSNLKVNSVHHTAAVEVTKDGTEAAAATGLGFAQLSGTRFAFERMFVHGPFIFQIRDKLNDIPVLVGRVADPTKKIP